jgi:hypothetical protein
MMLRTSLLALAALGLTGCAVYPAAPYGAVYEPAPVYVAPAPVFIGGTVHYQRSRGYSRPPGPQRPHGHGHGHGPRPPHRPHR